jgi:Protein of unknown function (DUF3761)
MRISPLFISIALAGGLASFNVSAKAPADATGECKDGTYTKANAKEGACSSHGGVKDWFDAKASPAPRPHDATGLCEDGTYTTTSSKSGACSGHKGVRDWYGGDLKAAPASEPASKAAPPASPTSTERTTKTQAYKPPLTAAPGGGDGKVWVNTGTKVYHCEKDEWYGKTKKGKYLTEAEAKASGARAARGKGCS